MMCKPVEIWLLQCNPWNILSKRYFSKNRTFSFIHISVKNVIRFFPKPIAKFIKDNQVNN